MAADGWRQLNQIPPSAHSPSASRKSEDGTKNSAPLTALLKSSNLS
jgi:hypothetical protein